MSTNSMQRDASGAVAGVDAKARTIRMVFSTGADVQRYDYGEGVYYVERLEVSEKAVDFIRLNGSAAPLLNGHRQGGAENVLGSIQSAWVEGGRAWAVAKFRDTAEADDVFRGCADGTIRSVSVGYQIAAENREQPKNGGLEIRTATHWIPYEISIVAVPADAAALIRSQHGGNMPDPVINMPGPGDQPAANQTQLPAQTPEQIRQEAIAEERARGEIIAGNAQRLGVDSSLADNLIRSGATIHDANAAMVARMSAMNEVGFQIRSAGAVQTVGDTRDSGQTRELMIEGYACRIQGTQTESDEAKRYASMDNLGISRALYRETYGEEPAGDTQCLNRLHNTGDLQLFLVGTGNRILASENEIRQTLLMKIFRATEAKDFRPKISVSASYDPELRKVTESGEYQYAVIDEHAESYSIATYGRIFSLTRQSFINDDLGALNRIFAMPGRQAAHFQTKHLLSKLVGNPSMADGAPVFSEARNNLLVADVGAGTNSKLSLENLAKARHAMRMQKAMSGELAGAEPRYLLVTSELELEARKLLAQVTASQVDQVNPLANAFELIVEPNLDAHNPTGWYLISGPELDTIEYSYLSGTNGPEFFAEQTFDVDAMKFKTRLDFGSGVVDFRGLYHGTGQ